MILHPAVIALLVSSGLMSLLVLYAAYFGVRIIRFWDLKSGSSQQIELERRTYLISTILMYVFGFQLISLFLYVYTADTLCTLFTGAMCAAGTLNVNRFGYAVLVLKLLNFVLAGLWLVVNTADNRGYDYPLIRKKYAFLLIITPLIVTETVFQARYFLALHPDIITSCCGSLFSGGGETLASELSAFPAQPMKIIFAVSLVLTIASGMFFYRRGAGGYLFALLAAVLFLVSIGSILSFIAPYVYELPTHHCPFCLIQREYTYVGYPLYVSLLIGAVAGMGVGILMPAGKTPSLAEAVPKMQKNLALVSVVSYAVFLAIVLYRITTSHLRM